MQCEHARVSAAHDKSERGKCRAFRLKHAAPEMRFHVIDAEERLAQTPRDRFRCTDSDEQTSDESGAHTDRNSIDLAQRQLRGCECFMHHGQNVFEMRTARDLRNNACVLSMQFELRSDDIGANAERACCGPLNDCSGGLIA